MKKSILFFDLEKQEHGELVSRAVAAGFSPIMNHNALRARLGAAGLPIRKWEAIKRLEINEATSQKVGQISKQLVPLLRSDGFLDEVFASESGNFMNHTGVDFVERMMCCVADEIATIERLKAHALRCDLQLIVLGCDNSHVERAVVLAARKLGIPTLQLAHGFYGHTVKGRTAGNMQAVYSDRIAIFGEREIENLVASGVDRDRIAVTGAPHWDWLYQDGLRIPKPVARKKLGVAPEPPVVLICSSYLDGSSAFFSSCSCMMFEQLQAIWASLNSINPDAQIVLRPHPHELLRATSSKSTELEADESFLEWLQRRGLSNVQIVRSGLQESVRAADVVVTIGVSSVIAEIMILQRPVVAWTWNDENPTHPVDASAGIICSSDRGHVLNSISNLMKNSGDRHKVVAAQNQALPGLNHKNDGGATQRVVDLIVELADGRKTRHKSGRGSLTKQGQRILQVVHDFPPQAYSGTELYTLHLSRELEKLGNRVSVVYPVHATEQAPLTFEQDDFEGLQVFKFNVADDDSHNRSDFSNSSYDEPFRCFLQQQKFDVIHFQHIYGLSVNWISIAKQTGAPVFLKVDDMFWYCRQIHLMQFGREYCSGPTYIDKCVDCLMRSEMSSGQSQAQQLRAYLAVREPALQNAFRLVDLVHSPSQFLKTTSLATGFSHDEFHVIPTGILPFEVQMRKRVRKQIRVGYLGEIHLRKGIHHFLEAIELARPALNSAPTTLKFIIYGNHQKDSLYESLLHAVEQSPDLEYRGGFTPQGRARIFSEIDILVVPSLGENYPFILREALYAGLPVIATAIAGVPEIVEHGRNGWLFPQGDAGALADILLELATKSAPFRHLKLGATKVRLIADEAAELQKLYLRFGHASAGPHAKQVAELFEKGREFIEANNLKAGLEALSSALNLDPRHPPSLRLLSEVYRRLGKDEDAQKLLALAES